MKKLYRFEELYGAVYQEQKVIIYGAGDYGKTLYWYLMYMGLGNRVAGYAVTNFKDISGCSECRVEVIEAYKEIKDECLVILAVSDKYQADMLEKLEALQYSKIALMTEELCFAIKIKRTEDDRINDRLSGIENRIYRRQMKLEKQPRYRYLILNILNHCN